MKRCSNRVLFLTTDNATAKSVKAVRQFAKAYGIVTMRLALDGSFVDEPNVSDLSWPDKIKAFELSTMPYVFQEMVYSVVERGPSFGQSADWYWDRIRDELTSASPCSMWPELEMIRLMLREFVEFCSAPEDVHVRLEHVVRRVLYELDLMHLDEMCDKASDLPTVCNSPNASRCSSGGATACVVK